MNLNYGNKEEEQGTGGQGGTAHGSSLTVREIKNATMNIYPGAKISIQQRESIINWLSPINFFLQQADISQMREKGTGGWLLADPVFKKWESSSGSTLWCCGIRM
jgi:hypothetical protein